MRLLGREELKEPREPRAFLVAIAKGLLFDYFRRAALEQAYLTELMLIPEAEQPSVEEQQMILEDLKNIDRLLGKLSSKARAAFLYNRLDGLGHAEIAERLGVSEDTIKSHRKNVYCKLDIGTQSELFSLFIDSLAEAQGVLSKDPLESYMSKTR